MADSDPDRLLGVYYHRGDGRFEIRCRIGGRQKSHYRTAWPAARRKAKSLCAQFGQTPTLELIPKDPPTKRRASGGRKATKRRASEGRKATRPASARQRSTKNNGSPPSRPKAASLSPNSRESWSETLRRAAEKAAEESDWGKVAQLAQAAHHYAEPEPETEPVAQSLAGLSDRDFLAALKSFVAVLEEKLAASEELRSDPSSSPKTSP